MARDRNGREVVVVERGDASMKWFLWGAAAGALLALLYAPSSGEQTRRSLQRRLRKLRALAEEKVDELVEQFGAGGREDDGDEDALEDGDVEPVNVGARAELERRLAEARARRRAARADDSAGDDEDETEGA